MITDDIKHRLQANGVNIRVDTILHRAEIQELTAALEGEAVICGIRRLVAITFDEFGMESCDDPVTKEFKRWGFPDRGAAGRRMLISLKRLSTVREAHDDRHYIQRTQLRENISEIRAKKEEARLFSFEESDDWTIVACEAYSKTGRKPHKEREQQNVPIERADDLRLRWQNALRIPGMPDWRYEKGK